MIISYPPLVTLEMSRHDAKELLALLKKNKNRLNGAKSRLCKELHSGLKPSLIYHIECRNCNNTYEVTTQEKLTKEQIIEGGYCSCCEGVYK